ncbi:MAG: preprotein translocase subunit SecG [Planctomycetota bacterium]
MSIWNILVAILHVVVCLLLVVIILIQQGKGGGLVGMLSGGSGDSLFAAGSRNPLRKITSVLAFLFCFSCIGLGHIFKAASLRTTTPPARSAPPAKTPAPETPKT